MGDLLRIPSRGVLQLTGDSLDSLGLPLRRLLPNLATQRGLAKPNVPRNVENVPGIHGLSDASVRRFAYKETKCSVINLFVGGYLQALSAGRWPSLIHSGSNPSEEIASLVISYDFILLS